MVRVGVVLSEIETIPSSLGDEQKPRNVIKINIFIFLIFLSILLVIYLFEI